MTKIDIQSKIDFDRTIGTEDRFNLRRWFEKLVATFNQSNSEIWGEYLDGDVSMVGFTDSPMDARQFVTYLQTCFSDGEYAVRYPNLKATFQSGLFIFSGTFESFTDGVLLCSGDIVIEISKDDEGESFKLRSQQLNPRFRVQK